MAMVTCPQCKKIVNDSSKKCPNCGAAFKYSVSDISDPVTKKLYQINTILLYVASALVVIDLLDVFKTYVGGVLLGIGIIAQGLLQARREKETGSINKKKVIIIIAMGVVVFAFGVVTLYFDLKK